MKIVGKTDIGLHRKENQDNYRAGMQPDQTVWAMVCDGMGGANGGKIASNIACDYLESEFLKFSFYNETDQEILHFLAYSIEKANHKIFMTSQTDEEFRGMGTTIVCCVIIDDKMYYAHVGDSRIYHYNSQKGLQLLTKDHSMVQELVEQGTITEQEASRHPRKNLITRALGVASDVEVDVNICTVEPNDVVLLCSDGLSNYINNQEIYGLLNKTKFFSQADVLVDKALQEGGQDNVTALLVQCGKEEDN